MGAESPAALEKLSGQMKPHGGGRSLTRYFAARSGQSLDEAEDGRLTRDKVDSISGARTILFFDRIQAIRFSHELDELGTVAAGVLPECAHRCAADLIVAVIAQQLGLTEAQAEGGNRCGEAEIVRCLFELDNILGRNGRGNQLAFGSFGLFVA